MGLLGIVLGIFTEIGADILSEKLLDKFRQDLFQVIGGLVLDQHQKFKREFSEAAYPLKEREIRPAIKKHFAPLTADRINEPLALEKVKNMFMESFLRPEFRETNRFKDLDPKYRHTLKKLAQEFNRQFEPKFVAICERNSVATTRLVINSLAESGKKEQEILDWLKKISAGRIDLSAQLTEVVELQLVPVLRKQIELEFSRFRDWDFTVQHLRGQTSEEQAEEKEWLEVLAQVLEWKAFKVKSRNPMPSVPGELFIMEKEDELGISAEWVCWGCPTEQCPNESLVRLVLTHLSQRKSAKAFVVSRNAFSAERVKLLEDFDVRRHLTLEQFLQTTLNIKSHKNLVVEKYEKLSIFHNFIDLECHQREAEKEPLDLQQQFIKWLQNNGTSHLSLLGNFGTGKTVFCRRMQYELLKNYQVKDRIPVLITLREQKGVKLPQMISSIMNDMGLRHLDYPAFCTLNRLGKFVVLIDGFDEMATYATFDEMQDNFLELAVLAEGKAKVMLTCRTHYFEHQKKEELVLSLPDFISERPEFQVLYLNPFTRLQIEAYLDRVRELYQDKQQVLDKMDQLPKLRELMEIPVLLDLILKVFNDLIEFEEDISLAKVYFLVANGWAKSEKGKGHLKNLSVAEVLSFMRELAWQMLQDDRLDINFKTLRSETKKKFEKKIQIDTHNLDAFYGEIKTCTFLTRDSLGNYKFAHKSFMEYFAAAYLVPLLRENKAPETGLNNEIREFMHQMLKGENYHDEKYRLKGDPPEGMVRKEGDPFTFIHDKDDSEMVWIPPGPFIAGGEYDGDEKPTRIMNLPEGAFLDKYPVTNAQYARFLNETGRCKEEWLDLDGKYKTEESRIQRGKNGFTVVPTFEHHPVNFVSFKGAKAYADWVGKEMVSEWVWEKAGRGIDGRTYPWGDELDWKKCNYSEHWAKQGDRSEKMEVRITPVKQFSNFGSLFGCMDLSGNLFEWTIDVWGKDNVQRVVRGGCFSFGRDYVRLPDRNSYDITNRYNFIGFRLSRTL